MNPDTPSSDVFPSWNPILECAVSEQLIKAVPSVKALTNEPHG